MCMGFEPRAVAPYPTVGYREVNFFDDFSNSDRALLVWYPVDSAAVGKPSKNPWDVFHVALNGAPAETKMPIIIISHGYTGNPHQLSWLIRGLVYHGFIVLGIQHRDIINRKVHANHWQRVKDVSTMLDQFIKSPLSGWGNLNKIGITGFSLGGTTSILIAGGRATKLDSLIPGPEYASPEDFTKADEALPTLNKKMMARDWRDSRVKAAFIMAPAWAWLFDESSLQKISIPTYLIASSADKVLVTNNNAGFFARNIPQAFYQEIPGKGSHYIFISAVNEQQRKKADPDSQLRFLFDEDATVDKSWIQFQVSEEASRFFKFALNQTNSIQEIK